jgi:hypothetical protein
MNFRFIILIFSLFIFSGLFAEGIFWTGAYNSTSVFDPRNWKDDEGVALTIPLVSNQPVNKNVTFGATANIITTQFIQGTFNAGTGQILFKRANVYLDYASVTEFVSTSSITIDSSVVMTGKVTAPSVQVKGKSELHFYEKEPIPANCTVNLIGDQAWVFFHMLTPTEVTEKFIKQFKINGFAAIASSNVRVTQYYGGTVVIPHAASFKAMYMYSGANLTGAEKFFRISYNSGLSIGVSGTATGASFILKKGYMACIAEQENGGGSSKIYIAEDSDLIINNKLNGKNNTVKMVRITPWRWLTKKGVGGGTHGDTFRDNWFYNWGSGGEESVSYPNREFVPMQWGKWNVSEKIEALKTQRDVTHLLGFNEPDHTDQSDMTVAECLALWPKLQEAGLRLGAPSILDRTMLMEFLDSCVVRGYRVDYLSLHNYGKITGTNYINNVVKPLYDKYKIPVWVTEYSYGANWNTDNGDNALTYYNGTKDYTEKMDASAMIERYAIFTFKEPDDPLKKLFHLYESYLKVLAPKGVFFREFESLPGRGNPLMYRTKISKAKKIYQLVSVDNLDSKTYGIISRNNDGISRRRIQVSTSSQSLNVGVLGTASMNTSLTNERLKFEQMKSGYYRIKAGHNCMALSVRSDSLVVEAVSQSDAQLWEVIPVPNTEFVSIKNKSSGKYILPYQQSITVGTVLIMSEITDIINAKAAHWSLEYHNVVSCVETSLGVFQMNVYPLSGDAPLTVTLSGDPVTAENKEAFYRWDIFENNDTITSTEYRETYTFNDAGQYLIKARGKDLVSKIINQDYVINVTDFSGLNDLSEGGIKIYPNPVHHVFRLQGMHEGDIFQIYDLQGKVVLEEVHTGNSVAVSGLSAGFYVLRSEGYPAVKLTKW